MTYIVVGTDGPNRMIGIESPSSGSELDPPDDLTPRPGLVTVRAIVLPVVTVLMIGLVFVSVYLSAFHRPQPHNMPLGVVGSAVQATQVTDGLAAKAPGSFAITRYNGTAAAVSAIRHRDIYGALDLSGSTPRLLYAGANGPSVQSMLTSVFGADATAHHQQLVTADVRPATAGDSRSLSVFYAAFGLVLAGFLFGLTTYQAAPRLPFGQRLVSLLLFGVLGGVLTVLVAGKWFGALPGPFAVEAGLVALMAISVGALTMLIVKVAGRAGIAVGSIALLTFGNATSGGVLPAYFLPGWLRPLSYILPPGVAVRAIDGAAYFDNAGLTEGIAILAGWVIVAMLAIYLLDEARLGSAERDQRNPAKHARVAMAVK
jgi:hypothetical protein